MKRINLLDIETSNKIAAGEVVERPFSVVKELIENSLDAEAKNIMIEILEGGQKSIKIIDDGNGIHPEDIHKAFLPHATSKISNIEDIFHINTLGFRGEALASIAAVSRVLLKSRTKDFEYGMEVSIVGGQIEYTKETGMNIGTIIEVKDLFFNVPARQKFLKSPQREIALISDIISRIALANHKTTFQLTHNDKKMLTTFGGINVENTIRNIYGKAISENIIHFEKHTDIASVYGYVGNAEISKGSRNYQSIFVNGRYIKNKTITAAVENAFKSFLMINKFPFYILFLDIFPEMIDVNIHPTKSEIKFEEDRQIFKLVFDAVHEAIRGSLQDSFLKEEEKPLESSFQNVSYEKQIVQLPIDLQKDFNQSFVQGALPSYDKEEVTISKVEGTIRNDCPSEINTIFNPSTSEKKEVIKEERSAESYANKVTLIENIAKLPNLKIIGQFNNTYILAEYDNQLYMIDQHAAHEKILFEKFRNDIKKGAVLAQVLLTPIVVELGMEDYLYYAENKDLFKRTGFEIEDFGDRAITIRQVPMILGVPNIKDLLLSMIDNLRKLGSGDVHEVKYDTIARLACKKAIKAQDLLQIQEMEALLQDLKYIEDPFTCPHGRPTIIKLDLKEIEKRFKRIQ